MCQVSRLLIVSALSVLLLIGCSGSNTVEQCVEPGDTCNDGLCFNGAANGVCDQNGECRTEPSTSGDCVVFLTSDEHDGNLGGLEGADAICQGKAQAAGLTGTFKAWLSDSSETAADRLTHSSVSYIDTRGQVIANDWEDLVDGSVQRPITVDESGFDWDADAKHCGAFILLANVWTGTAINGDRKAPFCSDWTDNSDVEAGTGHIGFYCYGSEAWTDESVGDTAKGCSAEVSLYCFQQ
jgi:hypothetical protein